MSRGYTASKDQVLKRLARAEGQVRGVTRTVERDRYCIDILTEISAAQAAWTKSLSASSTPTPATACKAQAKHPQTHSSKSMSFGRGRPARSPITRKACAA